MPDTVKSSDPTPIIRFADVCKTFRYRGGASRLDDDDDDDDDAEAVSEPDETKSDDSGLKPGETRVALQNINLSIFPGERVGIIGGNGSGKSTLLSIVSGMSHPTSGIVVGRGSLVHLSEITKPFNPTWDGLRNLRVLAQFLGFRPELIEDNAARIARFAGMEDSILEPVATYSKGMFARLAFAAALELDGDIYIADDSIGVGDQAYQSKSFNRLVEICRSGKTLLFASHRLRLVEQLCTRVIWLDKGEVRADGKPAAVIANYCAATGDVSEQAIQDDGTQFGAWFRQKYIAEYPLPPTFILETRAISNELVGEHASKIGGIVSLQLVTPQEPEGLVHDNAALVVQVAIKVSSPDTTIDLMLEIIKGKLLVYQALIPEPLKVSASTRPCV